MRVAAAISLAIAVCAAAGCGASPTEQVREKVTEFARSVANRDYKTMCDDVLAPSLILRLTAAGVTCEQGVEIAVGGVRNPVLSIGRITVSGKSASAVTLTSAQGQQASVDSVGLIETGQGWRVSSLGTP